MHGSSEEPIYDLDEYKASVASKMCNAQLLQGELDWINHVLDNFFTSMGRTRKRWLAKREIVEDALAEHILLDNKGD